MQWLSTDPVESQEPEPSLRQLPPDVRYTLEELVLGLPSHPDEQAAIQSAVTAALEKWSRISESAQATHQQWDNVFVILSSPITAVSRILTESLAQRLQSLEIPIRLLDWVDRPEAKTIATKLQQQLGRGLTKTTYDTAKEIVMIPNLSWCFLRELEGLDGIDYLRDVLWNDPSRFWIIGIDSLSWKYLETVCQLQAYCDEPLELPRLNGQQLQDWLRPLVHDAAIRKILKFNSTSLRSQLNTEQLDLETEYFRILADRSEGLSTVAIQLFLHSLAYSDDESKGGRLETQFPTLPSLPELTTADYYLLYSLLLHGSLTIAHLADSLGESQSLVQSRVTVLRRAGVIEQQKLLQINPLYYPQLRRTLAGNNFLI